MREKIKIICLPLAIFLPLFIFPSIFERFDLAFGIYYSGLFCFSLGYELGKDKGHKEEAEYYSGRNK